MPGGPDDEIDRIFVTHGEKMLRLARRLLDSEEDAEDAVQDVLLALLRAPHVLADVESLGAWLVTLVRRRCVDLVRKAARRPKPAGGELEALVPDEAGSVVREDAAQTLAKEIAALPQDLRFAFVENSLHEKSFKQMESESGIPMGTLMARKQKAVALLRQRLRVEFPKGA